MANVWKDCNAKAYGERQLAAQLAAIDDPKLTLLFNVDFIPGGREIDILLIHEDIGVFVVEVKGVGIDAIKSVSPTSWGIEHRETSENPLLQAYRQYEGLRDFLKPHICQLPFIAVTACLPKIKRRQWRERYRDSPYANAIEPSLLFEEDLYSGKVALLERLRLIHSHPPVRQGQPPRGVSAGFMGSLRRILEPAMPSVPTIGERERLAALEGNITAKLQAEFPIDASSRAVFSGLPGTGKTFRLLSIGAIHSYAGRRVLFACFNKTLASDIRRLLSFSERLRACSHAIEVLDVNQLAGRCYDVYGLGFIESANADEWGELLVDELDKKGTGSIQQYDLVLVDEAQDMKAWQLDLLDLHVAKGASLIIAVGEGQELYRNAASSNSWLNAHDSHAAVVSHKLRRNFRNPKQQYFFAQAFFDAWPDKFDKITACKESLFRKAKQAVLFDRENGDGPKYLSLPVREEEFRNLASQQSAIAAETFFDVISDGYDRMMEDGNFHPVSLLVLVPNSTGLHRNAARLALDRLRDERKIDYIDYTDDDARRASASQNQIRLCTFHSARGLEGEHVIVFGLENVQNVAKDSGAPPQNLAFIALSRGIFSTTIAIRATPRNQIHELCERILQAI